MHKYNLISENRDKLIIFFCGWGMDYTPFYGLESDEYDVLVFYHYTEINTDIELSEYFEKYKEVNLMSWSMGVWYSSIVMNKYKDEFNHKIAINGTLKPIDDQYGINTKVYQATIDNFSKIGRAKFFKRMWNNTVIPERFISYKTVRELDEQKAELIFLRDKINELPQPKNIFKNVIIAENDLICPTKNQVNFWSEKNNYKSIDSSHFIFYLWRKWEEVVEYAIKD